MTDLMDVLDSRICDAFVAEMLHENGEYFCRMRWIEQERKALNALLEGDAAQRVSDLLDEKAAVAELREWAYFRAGFQIALTLTR